MVAARNMCHCLARPVRGDFQPYAKLVVATGCDDDEPKILLAWATFITGILAALLWLASAICSALVSDWGAFGGFSDRSMSLLNWSTRFNFGAALLTAVSVLLQAVSTFKKGQS
jgi:hypothetical protein